jgi:Glycosyl hydrolase family 57
MSTIDEYTHDLPAICGMEDRIAAVIEPRLRPEVFRGDSPVDLGHIRSACAIALHMHQPLIPAGGADLRTAAIISNLQYMMENQHVGDNHNAPVFVRCYKRMGEFVPQLLKEGAEPRVMLEYSGTLLHGLRTTGLDDVIDALRMITEHPRHRRVVEWVGAPWGHAVAPSTPVQDYRHHVGAWQQHFAAIFGLEALARVRGFSPSEMALPNHPDLAYEFVRTLRDAGYDWVLVQEHTVERPETGRGPEQTHLPHRLVCTSSRGESASIVAIIKTQGSDTKLVAQMQPWHEARGLEPGMLGGRRVPPLVTQIADGENGGVMMNEFPATYFEVVREATRSATPLVNVTEYLEQMFALGVHESDLPVLEPLHQKRIWDRMRPGAGPERLAAVIEELEREDGRFHMDGGSWTNNISWVRGYEHVLGDMEQLSSLFCETVSRAGVSPREYRYRNALFHLLVSQTSCYRYWGQGVWTDYGREICRRGQEILRHDF